MEKLFILSNTDSNTNQPRLLSFTLDGWSVLGGRVTVSLHDGVSVLVGRNGAGKSAILEGFESITVCAIGRTSRFRQTDIDIIPKILEIEVLTPTNRRIEYKYELLPIFTSDEDVDIDDPASINSAESQFSWNDCCRYLDGQKEILWNTENGMTSFNMEDHKPATILGNISSFGRYFSDNSLRKFPVDGMQWIYTILKRVRILCKPTIIQRYKRRESLLTWSRKRISRSFDSADRLSEKIFRLFDAGELDELNSVCQRVGLGENISVRKFFSNRERSEIEEYVFSVEVDGVNIGLLSDGTIRVLSILMEVISSKHGEVIIIEEPEAQIHPAMLAKLLNEIETYTYGQNLIISTHSPQVVAWASPEKINLVHRKDGKTFVSKLGEAQIHNVIEYLSEEGDLGEWIYSGILDDE